MRILFLSNFYPPAEAGGYTLQCQETREALIQRGHRVWVVTSTYRARYIRQPETEVYRELHLESDDLLHYHPWRFFISRRYYEQQDMRKLRDLVTFLRPGVVMVWGMWGLSKVIPATLERLGDPPVAYYVSDHWPSDSGMHLNYWRLPARRRVMRLPKRVLGWVAERLLTMEGQPVKLRFEHAACVSAALRSNLIQAGLTQFERARVIHNGIDVRPFLDAANSRSHDSCNEGVRLLYAGRLVPEKGVHTVIDALALLIHRDKLMPIYLTVLGDGPPDYCSHLRRLVSETGLHKHVLFQRSIPREQMPKLMQHFDILVFPSIYEEALARMPMEAMAAGLVVVGTTTGGTKELLRDGENGLTFTPGDAHALAHQIKRLALDPALRKALVERGKITVLTEFTLGRMVDQIEQFLVEVVASASHLRL